MWTQKENYVDPHLKTLAWLVKNVFWKIEMPDSGKVAFSTPDIRKKNSVQSKDSLSLIVGDEVFPFNLVGENAWEIDRTI